MGPSPDLRRWPRLLPACLLALAPPGWPARARQEGADLDSALLAVAEIVTP